MKIRQLVFVFSLLALLLATKPQVLAQKTRIPAKTKIYKPPPRTPLPKPKPDVIKPDPNSGQWRRGTDQKPKKEEKVEWNPDSSASLPKEPKPTPSPTPKSGHLVAKPKP